MEPQDHSLLWEFLGDRQGAPWGQALTNFEGAITGTIRRVLGTQVFSDRPLLEDLRQDVYLRLCSNDYRILRTARAENPASLFALVKTVAITTTLDHIKRSGAQNAGVPVDETRDSVALGTMSQEFLERQILLTEMEDSLNDLPDQENLDRDRHIFRLYFRHGLSTAAISRIRGIGLSDSGVESVVHRITLGLRAKLNPKTTKGKRR